MITYSLNNANHPGEPTTLIILSRVRTRFVDQEGESLLMESAAVLGPHLEQKSTPPWGISSSTIAILSSASFNCQKNPHFQVNHLLVSVNSPGAKTRNLKGILSEGCSQIQSNIQGRSINAEVNIFHNIGKSRH